MSLTTKEKQTLKAKAHHLKPVVLLGSNGLTDAVNKEIDRALFDHELIKVKLSGDKATKKALLDDICAANKAELVGMIGNIGILYREREED